MAVPGWRFFGHVPLDLARCYRGEKAAVLDMDSAVAAMVGKQAAAVLTGILRKRPWERRANKPRKIPRP